MVSLSDYSDSVEPTTTSWSVATEVLEPELEHGTSAVESELLERMHCTVYSCIVRITILQRLAQVSQRNLSQCLKG